MEDIEAVLIVLRQLGLLTEDARQSKYLGQMEALDAVFQMNGPSRAITKLKKQYTAEAVRL